MTGSETAVALSNPRVRIAPVPDWVVHQPFDVGSEAEGPSVSGGIATLFLEAQINLTTDERAWNWRYCHQVFTRTGAERLAHFSVVFDPSFEKLDIHYIRVRRGTDSVEHTKAEAFEIFRREQNMERLVLDGRLTVAQAIPDVRPGDSIEVCCTSYGINPVLRGKHAAWVRFQSNEPVLERRYRLLRPVHREVAMRFFNGAPAPEIIEANGYVDMRWRSTQRTKFDDEDLAPRWLFTDPWVQFSEYSNWGEVAALFTPLYDVTPLPDDLCAAVDRLGSQYTDAADRAVQALFFVQKHMRYLALSFGEGGYAPRPINSIWSTAYGDCKDAARLYCAVAQRLGLNACPTLVSTIHGSGLDKWLPTAEAFDHCIVRVKIGDKIHWLDPTLRSQAGRLDTIGKPHYGWALTLAAGTETLEHMGDQKPLLLLDVDERVRFGSRVTSPAQYGCRASYYFSRADWMRDRIANEGANAIGHEYTKMLQTHWLNVTESAPLQVETDDIENRVTTIERYDIPEPWRRTEKGVRFSTHDLFLEPEMRSLPNTVRRNDIELGRQRTIRRRVQLDLPEKWPADLWDQVFKAPGLRYSTTLTREREDRLVLQQELVIDSEVMPAASIADYSGIVREMRQGDVYLSWNPEADRPGTELSTFQRAAGFVVLTVWALIVGSFILRTMHILP